MDMLRRTLKGAAAGMLILDPEIVVNADAKPETELAGNGRANAATAANVATDGQRVHERRHRAIFVRLVKSVENHIIQLYRQLNLDRDDRTLQPRVHAVIKYIEQTKGVDGSDP